MGLREDLATAVGSVFSTALSDIPVSVQYTSLTAGSTGVGNYDIASGVATLPGQVYTLPSVVFTRFKEDDSDRDVQVATDMKMIFPAAAIPVAPKTKDLAVDSLGRKFIVIRMQTDPAGVTYTVHVRTT